MKIGRGKPLAGRVSGHSLRTVRALVFTVKVAASVDSSPIVTTRSYSPSSRVFGISTSSSSFHLPKLGIMPNTRASTSSVPSESVTVGISPYTSRFLPRTRMMLPAGPESGLNSVISASPRVPTS